MNSSACFLWLALALAAPPCAARDAPALPAGSNVRPPVPTRPQYQRCLDASGGVTPAMQDCIDAEYAFQDRRLNQVYRRLIARLPKADAARLRERQRAWIKQRDRDCDPGASPGQGQSLDADGCQVRKTAERATQLQAQLDGAR